jgi:hypothetical protein
VVGALDELDFGEVSHETMITLAISLVKENDRFFLATAETRRKRRRRTSGKSLMRGQKPRTATGASNAEPAEDSAREPALGEAAGLPRIVNHHADPSQTERVSASSALEPGEEGTLDISHSLRVFLRVSASKWNSTGLQRLRNQDDHLPRDLPSRLRNRLMDSLFVSRAPLEKPAAFLFRRPFSTNFSPRLCIHLPGSACGKLVHKPWRFRSVPERTGPPDRYPGSAFPNLRRRRAEARPVRPHFSH